MPYYDIYKGGGSMIAETAFLWLPIVFFLMVKVLRRYAFADLMELRNIAKVTKIVGKRDTYKKQGLRLFTRILLFGFGASAILYVILVMVNSIDLYFFTVPTWLYLISIAILLKITGCRY